MSEYNTTGAQVDHLVYLNPASPDFSPNRLLTPSAVSLVLGVTTGTLSVWRSTNRYALNYIKCGRLVKYRVEDVLNFLSERTVSSGGDKK